MKWKDIDRVAERFRKSKYKLQLAPFFGYFFKDYCLAVVRRVKK